MRNQGTVIKLSTSLIPFFCLLFLTTSCIKPSPDTSLSLKEEKQAAPTVPTEHEETAEPVADPPFKKERERAQQIVAGMNDVQLAGQVLMTGIDGNSVLSDAMKNLLQQHPPGALMLFRYNIAPEKDTIRTFLAECSAAVPDTTPFIAIDHEGGLVHRLGSAVKPLPAAGYFWQIAQEQGAATSLQQIEESAWQSGQELKQLGITLNLAPVAEILTDENSRFLETRSYGTDPAFTEKAVTAFVRGMKAAGVACVVKHFPGNSGVDPHQKQATLPADRTTLARAISPFAAVIRDDPPAAIMVSHIVVPAFDPEHNASLSPAIMVWLREELGFSGVLLADDFSMAAVSGAGISGSDAIVQGLNAGLDMVMTWPSSLASAHTAILSALNTGQLSRERLRQSVERIIFEKLYYGILSSSF
jgi:beta-N-acetylhexosaminidase